MEIPDSEESRSSIEEELLNHPFQSASTPAGHSHRTPGQEIALADQALQNDTVASGRSAQKGNPAGGQKVSVVEASDNPSVTTASLAAPSTPAVAKEQQAVIPQSAASNSSSTTTNAKPAAHSLSSPAQAQTQPTNSPASSSSQSTTLSTLLARRNALLQELSANPALHSAITFPNPSTAEESIVSKDKSSSSSSSEAVDEAAILAAADAVVKRHIRLLHTYNEIRDVGLGLIGMIAEGRSVRLRDLLDEFGVDAED